MNTVLSALGYAPCYECRQWLPKRYLAEGRCKSETQCRKRRNYGRLDTAMR